ncbi:MAG TPA: hypothetical protein VM221_09580, partial [Armatimonadota bacterium]|nr:hypothetical protein [Armatimonadota bacterium]
MTDTAPDPHPPGPGLRERLFDPFTYVAGARSLALGLAAIMLAGFVGSFSNTHFDGVLDAHTGVPARLPLFLGEGLVNWLCAATVLFVMGKLASRTAFRAIDLFGTQAMARWPSAITAVLALAPPYQRYLVAVTRSLMSKGRMPAAPATEVAVFAVVLLGAIMAAVWMVWLMYRSYSTCCNIRGAAAVGTFIAGLLVAEAASKLILFDRAG